MKRNAGLSGAERSNETFGQNFQWSSAILRRLVVAFALIALTPPLVTGEQSRGQLMSELFGLIDQADEMVVYSEGFKREFVVYRSSNWKDFEELKSAITLKSDA